MNIKRATTIAIVGLSISLASALASYVIQSWQALYGGRLPLSYHLLRAVWGLGSLAFHIGLIVFFLALYRRQ